MTVTFPYSSAPVKQVKEIQFGIMSPEEIVRCHFKPCHLQNSNGSDIR